MAATVKELDHWIHLNSAARADLAWWHTFLRLWNGKSLLPPSCRPLFITSDASGFWGCGAQYKNLWFQLQWSESWKNLPISPKESVPIVIAVILWGPYWMGRHICCLCDNTAVVAVVNKGAARDPTLSHLLRLLAFALAVLDIILTVRHLPGAQNMSADALARNNLQLFFSLNPQASPVPAIIPAQLRELVFNRALVWSSPNWTALLSASWEAALRLPPAQPTIQPNDATRHSAYNTRCTTHSHWWKIPYVVM